MLPTMEEKAKSAAGGINETGFRLYMQIFDIAL